jgi:lipopolysaccharide transport system ATP-binding protein
MLVRLAFAVSVCVQPDILIVDEALAVGDIAFQFKCLERLHQLIDNGRTLLFVSHDISLVRSFCDFALLLDQGRMAAFGPSLEVTETYLMSARQEQMAHSITRAVAAKATAADGQFAFGTNQGRVVKAVFENSHTTRGVFASGDTIAVTMEVEYDDSVRNPCLSLIVLDQRMLVLAGEYCYLPISDQGADLSAQTVQCRFQAPLCPGEYFINLRLEERLSDHLITLIDKQVGALSFEIFRQGEATSWGALDMEMTFTIPGENTVPVPAVGN